MFKPSGCTCLIIVVAALLLCTCGSAALIATGVIPVWDSIWGSSEPVDLGIRYSEETLLEAREVMGVEIENSESTEPTESVTYTGEKELKTGFTNEQMTALLNNNPYIYHPIEQIQIKVGEDGTVRMSGVLILDNVNEFAVAYGFPQYNVEDLANKYNVGETISFYVEGTGTVENNATSLDVHKLQFGKFGVPENYIGPNTHLLEKFFDDFIQSIPGLDLKSAEFRDEKFVVDAITPDTEIHTPDPNYEITTNE